MLTLTVRQQKNRRNLNLTLRTLHPHLLPLQISKSRPCTNLLIQHHQHTARPLAWMKIHADRLTYIRLEADPTGEAYKDIEHTL